MCDDITETSVAAVIDADPVILCVPVGGMGAAAAEFAADLPAEAIVSDVGSPKAEVLRVLTEVLPGQRRSRRTRWRAPRAGDQKLALHRCFTSADGSIVKGQRDRPDGPPSCVPLLICIRDLYLMLGPRSLTDRGKFAVSRWNRIPRADWQA